MTDDMTPQSDDGQLGAEQLDDDVVGGDVPVTSDEVAVDFPPERLLGVPFADADVTDESLAERHAREEPEVWEGGARPAPGLPGAADERLEQIVELEAD